MTLGTIFGFKLWNDWPQSLQTEVKIRDVAHLLRCDEDHFRPANHFYIVKKNNNEHHFMTTHVEFYEDDNVRK